MQTLGAETNGISMLTAHAVVKQGPDAGTIQDAVANAVAAYVLAHPEATLIDLDLAGGGAGNTFFATLLLVPGSVSTPTEERVANMVFHWFQASDMATLQAKMNVAFPLFATGSSLWAWDVSSAGAGALWIACLVTWLPGE